MQANGNLKEITFDTLVNKFVEREKYFGKKTTPQSTKEAMCLAHREKNHAQDSLEEEVVEEEEGEEIS